MTHRRPGAPGATFDNPLTSMREDYLDGVLVGTVRRAVVCLADPEEVRAWRPGLLIGHVEALPPSMATWVRELR